MGCRCLMLLWRLSGTQHADVFDGGYGLLFDGRWNSVGHAITYCSTSPSLCILEKLVHVDDPALLPSLIMVTYEVRASAGVTTIGLDTLPAEWQRQETLTQKQGDDWHGSGSTPLLCVPSAIVPLQGSPDVNFLINHNHPGVHDIKLIRRAPFVFDSRLI